MFTCFVVSYSMPLIWINLKQNYNVIYVIYIIRQKQLKVALNTINTCRNSTASLIKYDIKNQNVRGNNKKILPKLE